MSLLTATNLSVSYEGGDGQLVRILSDVNLDLDEGRSLALVGESGCGKSTLALALLNALPKFGKITGGTVTFRTRDGDLLDLTSASAARLARFHWVEAAVVFQGAMNSLNPLLRVRTHFEETIRAHRRGTSTQRCEEMAREALELVELPAERVLRSYPHELSGGMKQRALIALALALRPRLLVMDEPTTALDVLTQRAVIDMLQRLRRELGFAVIFVTHDLGLASELADRVATMYGGRVVELGTVAEVFGSPRHPYTAGLIQAVPRLDADRLSSTSIPGSPPSFRALPTGCPFQPRCAYAQDDCAAHPPPLVAGVDNSTRSQQVACLHPLPEGGR